MTTSRPNFSITAVVPVYNEELALERAVGRIDDYLRGVAAEYQIIIVESGSTDRTAEICKKLTLSLPSVSVIHEGARNGFGSALKLGFAAAKYELVWVVPVDLPFPLETLNRAVVEIRRSDAVLSYRIDDRRSLYRRIQSAAYSALCTAALGVRLKSVNSAFKLYRREIIQDIPLQSSGWFIDAEIAFYLGKRRAKVVELPVQLIDRDVGSSTVGPLASIQVIKELIRFRKSVRK